MEGRTDAVNVLARPLLYMIFVLAAIACLFPFYWMFSLSTHSTEEIIRGFPLLPGRHLLGNFAELLDKSGFFASVWNSIFVTSTSTIIALFFSTMGGFAFAKYVFRGRRTLFLFVLATMMIPIQIGLVALVKLMNILRMYDTYAPLIFYQMGTPFGIFWMSQYIRQFVPGELIESARMEGANELAILLRIVFPVSTAALMSLAIIQFVNTWNSYLLPLVLLQTPNRFTLPLVIASIQGKHQIDYGPRFLAVSIGTLPLILFFLFSSKRIIESISAVGSVKG